MDMDTLRPKKFKGIVGQEQAVSTLQKLVATAVSGAPFSRFILLSSSGPGTGKTTLARILAAAINCANLDDNFEPCGECSGCQSAFAGNSHYSSVTEINAADHNGVDDMRKLIEDSGRSVPERFRVIIMDEAHQLSPQSQNVMLKPLEEPKNPNLVYIWVTTEANRLIKTIESRALHITLKPVDHSSIESLLGDIADENPEDFGMNPEFLNSAIENISNSCGGSVRSALRALELYSLSDGKSISAPKNLNDDIVKSVLDEENLAKFFVLCAEGEESLGSAFSYSQVLKVLHLGIKERIIAMYADNSPAAPINRLARSMGKIMNAFRDVEQSNAPKLIVEGVVADIIGTNFGDVSRSRDKIMYEDSMTGFDELNDKIDKLLERVKATV